MLSIHFVPIQLLELSGEGNFHFIEDLFLHPIRNINDEILCETEI